MGQATRCRVKIIPLPTARSVDNGMTEVYVLCPVRDRSSVWLERLPVTQEVAGSSPVGPAIKSEKPSEADASEGFFVCILYVGQLTWMPSSLPTTSISMPPLRSRHLQRASMCLVEAVEKNRRTYLLAENDPYMALQPTDAASLSERSCR